MDPDALAAELEAQLIRDEEVQLTFHIPESLDRETVIQEIVRLVGALDALSIALGHNGVKLKAAWKEKP